jgi:hypothetical protein
MYACFDSSLPPSEPPSNANAIPSPSISHARVERVVRRPFPPTGLIQISPRRRLPPDRSRHSRCSCQIPAHSAPRILQPASSILTVTPTLSRITSSHHSVATAHRTIPPRAASKWTSTGPARSQKTLARSSSRSTRERAAPAFSGVTLLAVRDCTNIPSVEFDSAINEYFEVSPRSGWLRGVLCARGCAWPLSEFDIPSLHRSMPDLLSWFNEGKRAGVRDASSGASASAVRVMNCGRGWEPYKSPVPTRVPSYGAACQVGPLPCHPIPLHHQVSSSQSRSLLSSSPQPRILGPLNPSPLLALCS